MSMWYKFKDGQYPRKNEIIAVRSDPAKKGASGIYPHLLWVKGNMDFYQLGCKSTKLAFHGLTHWRLIDSPYCDYDYRIEE